MNTHELPMILFTVIAQMCVGAFITLGIITVVGRAKYDKVTVERVTEPALFAIGPALVLGLGVSMLHMNDVMNTLNVLRHWNSSWLSREIIFGCAFAGAGFLFAVSQWYKLFSYQIRQVIAVIAAVFGICLVYSMSQIYYSLKAVPAWHTWIVPFHFAGTTILLGALAVGTAIMATISYRFKEDAASAAPAKAAESSRPSGSLLTKLRKAPAPAAEDRGAQWEMATVTLQAIAVVTALTGTAILISYILHISNLAGGDPVAQASAGVFTGGFFFVRLALLAIAAILLALFTFRTAGQQLSSPAPLTWIISIAFALAFVTELMGRSLHYDSMMRIGI